MKNKLYKHHKSKAALMIRNISLAVSAFALVIGLAAIPTYISASSIKETSATSNTVSEVKEEDNTLKEKLQSLNLD